MPSPLHERTGIRYRSPKTLPQPPTVSLKHGHGRRRPSHKTIVVAAHRGKNDGSDDDEDEARTSRSIAENSPQFADPSRAIAQNVKEFMLGMLRRLLPSLVVFLAGILSLIAVTPLVLSTPLGLQTALSVSHAMLPNLRVTVDAVDAGWLKPVSIHGITVTESASSEAHGSLPHDPASRAQGTDAEEDAGLASTPPRSDEALPVEKQRRRHPLLAISSIRSTVPLWNIVVGRGPLEILLGPTNVDLTLSSTGDLRSVKALQEAGVIPRPLSSASSATIEGTGTSRSTSSAWTPAASLQRADAEVKLSLEVVAGGLTLAMPEGRLLVPMEFREALGDHLHVEALRGAEAIQETATDAIEHTTPFFAATRHLRQAEMHSGDAGANDDVVVETNENSEYLPHHSDASLQYQERIGTKKKAAESTHRSSWPGRVSPNSRLSFVRSLPIRALPPDAGYPTTPVLIRVDSPTVRAELCGWETNKGYTVLAHPATAEAQLTPSMTRLLLNRLNPLLGSAAQLHQQRRFVASLEPRDGVWPAESFDIRVDPLQVNVGQGAAISRALEVASVLDGGFVKRLVGTESGVEVKTGPLLVHVGSDGKVDVERTDFTIGGGFGASRRALHVITWGKAHVAGGGALDMIIALPVDALAGFGLSELPEDHGLAVRVQGTVARPLVQIAAPSKDLAVLVLRNKARQLTGARRGLPRWLTEDLALEKDATLPSFVRLPKARVELDAEQP